MGNYADVIEAAFRNTEVKATCDNICDDCMRQSPGKAEEGIKKHIRKVVKEYLAEQTVKWNRSDSEEFSYQELVLLRRKTRQLLRRLEIK